MLGNPSSFCSFESEKLSSMKSLLNSLILVLTLGMGVAGAQPHLKIGASIGNGLNKGLFDLAGDDLKVDKADIAWKAYASLSGKFLGLEAGYRNLGMVELSSGSNQGHSKSRGVDLFSTGTINMGPIAIFGKAGAYVGTTENQLRSLNNDPDINELYTRASFAWGTGAALNLSIFHFRIEYEKIMLPNQPLGMLSFGAGFNLF